MYGTCTLIIIIDHVGGPLNTGRVTTGFYNRPVENGTFDSNFYTKFYFSRVSTYHSSPLPHSITCFIAIF